jgi:hypothetical protein
LYSISGSSNSLNALNLKTNKKTGFYVHALIRYCEISNKYQLSTR